MKHHTMVGVTRAVAGEHAVEQRGRCSEKGGHDVRKT
jgi:hypothetical protein